MRLVLLHGFTGSPASFDELTGRLAARHPGVNVLRPALLGHGLAADDHACRFEQEVDRLARVVSATRMTGAHLCGYSLGARVALGLLARHAHLFGGATLIGVHPGLAGARERALRVGSDERWCARLDSGDTSGFIDAWEAQPLFATQQRLTAPRAAHQRRVRAAQRAAGLARALRVLGLGQMPDYRGVLRMLALPVRLVVGALDAKFGALARGLVASAPRARLELVPGVGHNVLLEAPAHVEGLLLKALGA
jgi:2-succinyl-6-hydroxy-2,4-cyclohexadiene-1-carboxylate synthase